MLRQRELFADISRRHLVIDQTRMPVLARPLTNRRHQRNTSRRGITENRNWAAVFQLLPSEYEQADHMILSGKDGASMSTMTSHVAQAPQ
jgi:hypothetical protein